MAGGAALGEGRQGGALERALTVSGGESLGIGADVGGAGAEAGAGECGSPVGIVAIGPVARTGPLAGACQEGAVAAVGGEGVASHQRGGRLGPRRSAAGV